MASSWGRDKVQIECSLQRADQPGGEKMKFKRIGNLEVLQLAAAWRERPN